VSATQELATEAEVREAISQAVERCIVLAERHYGRAFPRIPVCFDLRGASAGEVKERRTRRGQVTPLRFRFNTWVATRHMEDFLGETVPHEVAHFVTRHLYKGRRNLKPHGPEWRRVMVECYGLPPERCHSYEVPHPYIFRCACKGRAGEWRLSVRKFNAIRRGRPYFCRSCHQVVVYSHKIDVDTGEVVERSPVGRVFVYGDGPFDVVPATNALNRALGGHWPESVVVPATRPESYHIAAAISSRLRLPIRVLEPPFPACTHAVALCSGSEGIDFLMEQVFEAWERQGVPTATVRVPRAKEKRHG